MAVSYTHLDVYKRQLIAYAIVPVAKKIPNGFLPDEDQGYLFAALIMPEARSLQLTTACLLYTSRCV